MKSLPDMLRRHLERFVDDDEVVIAESCEVALDLLEWVASKRLDYSE